KGRAMTYYGRWTYKYEIAAAKGAAGILIIHEWNDKTNSGPAAYPWEVARGMMVVENFDLVAKDNNMSRVNVEGWITEPMTSEIRFITARSTMRRAARDWSKSLARLRPRRNHRAVRFSFWQSPLKRKGSSVQSTTQRIQSTRSPGRSLRSTWTDSTNTGAR